MPRLDNGRVDDPTFPAALQGRVTRIEHIVENERDRWVAYGLDDNGHEIAYAEYRIGGEEEGETAVFQQLLTHNWRLEQERISQADVLGASGRWYEID